MAIFSLQLSNSGEHTILLVLDQNGETCLRAKHESSNDLLKIIANNLEERVLPDKIDNNAGEPISPDDW